MTDEQKITRVLACCGKAPRSSWAFDDAEKAAVAALCGDDGLLVEGGQEAFRLLMVEHYERRKATSAEFENPVIGTGVDHPFAATDIEVDEPTLTEDSE
jgi:hypothetical protein